MRIALLEANEHICLRKKKCVHVLVILFISFFSVSGDVLTYSLGLIVDNSRF